MSRCDDCDVRDCDECPVMDEITCNGVCSHCGNRDCEWYDDFMDGEDEDDKSV